MLIKKHNFYTTTKARQGPGWKPGLGGKKQDIRTMLQNLNMDCILHKWFGNVKLSQGDNKTVIMKCPCSWEVHAKIFRDKGACCLQLFKCSVTSMEVGI